MKELDFDELDRAVNSLVGQTSSKANGPAKTDKPPVQPAGSISGNLPKSAPPTASQQVTVSRPSKTPSTPVTPAHRTGRLDIKRPATTASGKGFMDIVTPKPSRPAPKVSRTGPAIQPASKEAVKPESAKPATPPDAKPAEKIEAPKVIISPAPEAKPEPAPKTNDEKWPDPLDFHASKDAPAQKPSSLDEEASPAKSSPFIPGTKVEKRPLGAFTPANAPGDEEKVTASKEVEQESAKPVEAPQESETPAVGANESTPKVASADKLVTADEAKEAEPSQIPEDSPTKQVRESAMMSIPQQYITANKPVDESPRPVFDTKDYHPPLLESTAHAAHRGGGLWGKLLVTLLVIAVLAVGGYFAFMYFVQNY